MCTSVESVGYDRKFFAVCFVSIYITHCKNQLRAIERKSSCEDINWQYGEIEVFSFAIQHKESNF